MNDQVLDQFRSPRRNTFKQHLLTDDEKPLWLIIIMMIRIIFDKRGWIPGKNRDDQDVAREDGGRPVGF